MQNMIKEALISIYLFFCKVVFNGSKLFPLKNKVTFLISFGDNAKYVYEEMLNQQLNTDVRILFTRDSAADLFKDYRDVQLIPFNSHNPANLLRSIYHLATSKIVIIDNYFAVLAVTNFKTTVKCIQLWHAAGAIKKFGLEDKSITNRSNKARKRFIKVYGKFNKVVVGSEKMVSIFERAFALSEKNILRTGIPRTDFFFEATRHKLIINKLYEENSNIEHKKIILYAPTYRDNQIEHFELKLDLNKMFEELGKEYVVLLRLHPAIKQFGNYEDLFPGFVYNYSSGHYDVNELLLISDILITDYSSLPYEFSLLDKPMIFYVYDLEQYKAERGLWEDFEETLPGPLTKQTDEVIKVIKEKQYNYKRIKEYSSTWNKYSDGHSSKSLVNYLFKDSKGHYINNEME